MYADLRVYSIILLGDLAVKTGWTFKKIKLEAPTSHLEEQNISEVELPPDLVMAWALYRHIKKKKNPTVILIM